MRYVFVALAMLATPAYAQEGVDKLKQAFAAEKANAPAAYSHKLERTFLEAGYSMSVFPKGGSLIVFGYISKALVFNAITKLDILRNAKTAGFKRVEFFDKGLDGRFVYDLSESVLPQCDVSARLCI